MTVMLDIEPGTARELHDEAERRGQTLEQMAKQALMRTLIEGLRDQPVPQSLDELKPRRLPPSGKTAMEMVYGQLETDETEEELLAALKAMG